MFKKNTITAYPTNTSYGLGVRADDPETLEKLYKLKERTPGKYFSLMMRDIEMLKKFAEVPENISANFFLEKPRTIILKPKDTLPKSKYWPKDKVAFRICTLPEVAKEISFPITATSANKTSEAPIFSETEVKNIFGENISYFPTKKPLQKNPPSEIWDYTVTPPERIR